MADERGAPIQNEQAGDKIIMVDYVDDEGEHRLVLTVKGALELAETLTEHANRILAGVGANQCRSNN
jgi:hypothetical protein